MPGLIPTFKMEDLSQHIDAFKRAKIKRAFEILSYIGIECVNYAKQSHTYTDQTGNLTSSIGYAVIYNGSVDRASMMAEESANLVEDLAKIYPEGMILVVVAGMEYAAAVESKQYDVITGASRVADDLKAYMKAKLGETFF